MSSTRLRLLKAATVPKRTLTIQTEDGPLLVEARGLSLEALGRIQNEAVLEDEEGEREMDLAAMGPRLIIDGSFDPETGTPLFTAADLDLVKTLSAGVLSPIMTAVSELSGLGDKALKAAEKN